jgi:hypothetical protein
MLCCAQVSVKVTEEVETFKVWLDGENSSLNADCAFTLTSNVHASFITELQKNVLSDF